MRIRQLLLTVAAPLVALPIAPASQAHAALAGVVGHGEWATALAGYSSCSNVGTVGISCSHGYTSEDLVTGIDTCVSSATINLGGPSVTVVNPCHATLTGISSGTGRAVGENAGVCTTLGIMTGTVSFSDSTGTSYPSITVSIVNNGGAATFFGSYVNAAGLTVAETEGTFTMACGGLAGSFAGTYTLL